MTGKVMETVVKLMGSIDPSLAKSIGTAQTNLKKMGKVASVAGKAIGGIAVVGATAAGAVAGYLIKSGTDYIRTMNDVSAQTGTPRNSISTSPSPKTQPCASNTG